MRQLFNRRWSKRNFPLFAKRVSIIFLAIVVVMQPNNYALGQVIEEVAPLLRPSISVPPLKQNQPLIDQAASDNAAQVISPIFAPKSSRENKRDYENWSKRTEHTKTMVGADGTTTKRISLSEPLHYKNGQAWEDLKPMISRQDDVVSLSIGNIKMSARPLKQGIDYEYKGKKFSVTIPGSYNALPKLIQKDGMDTLIYENVFKGVDITYTISGYSIKEAIVLKDEAAPTEYTFNYKGATLSKHPSIEGAAIIEGLPDQELYLTPLNVSTKTRFVTDPVVDQAITPSSLKISLNKDWLQERHQDEFPVVVDPTIRTLNKTAEDMLAIRSDGYRCGINVCSPQAGNEEYPDYWAYWRTLLKIPFNEIIDDKTSLGFITSARLHFVRNGGVSEVGGMTINPAGCWDFNCAITEPGSLSYADIGTDTWMDVRDTINWMLFSNMTDQPLMLRVPGEALAYRNYKSFDLSQMVLEIQYQADNPPPQPDLVYPLDKKVISNLQPILSVNPVTDPDGDPVSYAFFLMPSPNNIISMVTTNDTHWVVPDGMLKDGVTYYWSANAVYGNNPSPGKIQSFKVDLRRGKSSTQSYATNGPVSIDQATGNLSTSISSHSLKALGGDIGVSLDYNTPAMSRPGLVAEYWGNETMAGSPHLTTLAPTVDFDWKMDSPPPLFI